MHVDRYIFIQRQVIPSGRSKTPTECYHENAMTVLAQTDRHGTAIKKYESKSRIHSIMFGGDATVASNECDGVGHVIWTR